MSQLDVLWMFKGYTNVLSCGRPTWDIHGRPKNGRLWYQLKIWEKLKDLTLSGMFLLVLINMKQRGYSSFPTSTQCPQDVLWISCERKPSVCLASATDILWMECLDQENTVHTGMSYGCPSVPIWDVKLIVRFRSLFWYPYDVQYSSRMYGWLHIRDWYQMDIHRTSQYDHPRPTVIWIKIYHP
jgi:hypothetical protein